MHINNHDPLKYQFLFWLSDLVNVIQSLVAFLTFHYVDLGWHMKVLVWIAKKQTEEEQE